MKYEDMSLFRKFFHTHIWKEPYNDEPTTCEECGFQPTCQKHGCKMYTHGYENKTDCLECFKEWRSKKGLL